MIEAPDILRRLRALVERGSPVVSLFDRSLVSRSRALELIDMLFESFPEELELARDVLERREQVLEDARQQAGEIVDDAVRRAERLVDADSITLEAQKRADEIRSEADEYVAQRLEALEGEIVRILEEVRAGIKAVRGHQ